MTDIDALLDYTGLTDRQRDILRFITLRLSEGQAASLREIGLHFGITSPNGVVCHVKALMKKGRLKHTAWHARSLIPAGVKILLVREDDEVPTQEGKTQGMELPRLDSTDS